MGVELYIWNDVFVSKPGGGGGGVNVRFHGNLSRRAQVGLRNMTREIMHRKNAPCN